MPTTSSDRSSQPPFARRTTSKSRTCAPCWKALPRLRKLSLAGKRVELGDIVAPVLEQFELRGGGLTEDNVRSVASATWPMLSTLIIWFGATRVPSPEYAVDIHYTSPFDGRSPAVLDILSGRNLSKVTFLGLMNTNFTDELCASLHTRKILPQLSVLDLSKGTMTEHGARHLLEHAAAYEHLEYLNVDENLIMDLDVRAALLETFSQIDFGVQRAPYGVMSVADLR